MASDKLTVSGWSATLLVVLTLFAFGACSTLPSRPTEAASTALVAAESGPLARTAIEVAQNLEVADSALLALANAGSALSWRLALIDSAKSSLDLQYFIWNVDLAGSLLMERVVAAADRGVRVRILVDDLYLISQAGMRNQDKTFAAVSAHALIELKLFNPGYFRDGTVGLAGNFAGSFSAFNRRMHNKLMIADGHFAIVGGRNIANEYFGLNTTYNFLDYDVLFTGAAVPEAQTGFDEFWQAEEAYPASALADAATEDFDALMADNAAFLDANESALSSVGRAARDWSTELTSLSRQMSPGSAEYLQDPANRNQDPDARMYNVLTETGSAAPGRIIIATAYLIPRTDMLKALREDIEAGIEYVLITNSLASNDHTAAASQYNKFRTQLLEAGAELYELRHQPSAEVREYADVASVTGGFIGLHMKMGANDLGECFIGSMNLDPRAIDINTENGLAIVSEAYCAELTENLETLTRQENAWRLTLDDKGRLNWTSEEGTTLEEPVRASGQRFSEFLFRLLPLESQL
jgi:putative cardiolipin synthase